MLWDRIGKDGIGWALPGWLPSISRTQFELTTCRKCVSLVGSAGGGAMLQDGTLL